MKTHTKIAWILALIVTIIIFCVTFIQSSAIHPARVMGQFAASAGVGLVVFVISYSVGALIARIKK